MEYRTGMKEGNPFSSQKSDIGPSIPVTPGAWLNRLRLLAPSRSDDNRRLSSEELGSAIGVAGRTILRWEAGRSVPSQTDLDKLAEYLRLSPFQASFIKRVFSSNRDLVEVRQVTGASAADLLLTEFPALLVDELFYIVGRNRHTDALGFEALPRMESLHTLRAVTRGLFRERPDGSEAILNYWFRSALLESASLCGLPQYQRLVRDLSRNPEIREHWLSLVLGSHEDEEAVCPGAPIDIRSPAGGSWRVFTSTVYSPKTLHIIECIPTDLAAHTALKEVGKPGAPEVYMLNACYPIPGGLTA